MAVAIPAGAAAAALALDIAETVLIQIVGQLVASVVGAALAPELAGLQEESFRLEPSLQLPLASVVEAVIKGHLTPDEGAQEARLSGISDDPGHLGSVTSVLFPGPPSGASKSRFQVLLDSAGEPPGLDFLTEAWRRGIIAQSGTGGESTSLEQGIRESRLKNKWVGVIEKMQYRLPEPSIVVEGWLRAQITEAVAKKYLAQAGITAEVADLWYKSSGRPPGPGELIELYRRGVIPEAGEGGDTLSLRQGYLETDLKNKWYEKWLELARYVPPPRTVTAMVREGAFTDAQALKFYKDAGLDQATAAAYLEAAHHQRVAAAKELSKATILALYRDKLIDHAAATAALVAEGWAETSAAYELEVADFTQEKALLDSVLNRLRALYVAHKLDKQATADALTSLGLTPAARDHQLSFWDQARRNNVAILTPPQIASLVKLGWLDFLTGVSLLEGHGYSSADAQLFILEHLKLTPNDTLPAGVTVSGP